MYQVWKINERGNYELVEEVADSVIAAAIKRALTKRGIWVQICKAGEMSINGANR